MPKNTSSSGREERIKALRRKIFSEMFQSQSQVTQKPVLASEESRSYNAPSPKPEDDSFKNEVQVGEEKERFSLANVDLKSETAFQEKPKKTVRFNEEVRIRYYNEDEGSKIEGRANKTDSGTEYYVDETIALKDKNSKKQSHEDSGLKPSPTIENKSKRSREDDGKVYDGNNGKKGRFS